MIIGDAKVALERMGKTGMSFQTKFVHIILRPGYSFFFFFSFWTFFGLVRGHGVLSYCM